MSLEVVNDPVNHPAHYTSDPSGVECITITRHRNFDIGNAIKYLWRAGMKESGIRTPGSESKQVEDLRKAIFYIEDEIKRIEQIQIERENPVVFTDSTPAEHGFEFNTSGGNA